jgi:hypothetical protein
VRHFKRLFLIACLAICSTAVFAQNLTEKAVRDLMVKVDQAAARKDADTVSKTLSDAVEITMMISYGGQTQRLSMNKDQYMAALRQGWAASSNYTYRRANEKIVLSGSKAYVSSEVFESMVINGQPLRTSSKESATLELINGALLVTKVFATASM